MTQKIRSTRLAQDIWVCSQHAAGVTSGQYRELLDENSAAALWDWRLLISHESDAETGTERFTILNH